MKVIIKLTIALFTALMSVFSAKAQDSEKMKAAVHADSLFWQAYNSCEVDRMASLLTDDIEFYHDKNGASIGKDTFVPTLRTGLCGKDFRLRRVPVDNTVNVFPLHDKDVLYGILITGEHYFYLTQNGKKEHRDGMAKFSTLWLLRDGEWKMAKVLSYDHRPAPYVNERITVAVASSALKSCIGTYKSAQAGDMKVTAEGKVLQFDLGGRKMALYPETETSYFMKERDLQFEFVTAGKKVSSVKIIENGTVVEEAPRIQ